MPKPTNASFSPSVNIQRDSAKNFEYVVTPNSVEIYSQIVSNFDSGIHSFSIIGSYGTGKSSFLVAFMRNLLGQQNIFEPLNGELKHAESFEFDLLVGRHESLLKDMALHLGLREEATDKDILEAVEKRHDEYKKNGVFWFIIIDEFGKYLEYAAKNDPDTELYFIQQLAEFANEQEKNLFLINTLHQAFDSYAFGLDTQQRKEWDKVKGRLKELAFNEPVEQLIYIASEHLKKDKKKVSKKSLNNLISVISEAQVFPLKNRIDEELARFLYPLDPISASTLALSLQTYGQNERSLFTFLNADDERGINSFDGTSNTYYGISEVYDYLIYNHHSFLSSKYNPHYIQWNALKKSIERVEAVFDKNIDTYKDITKVIGLLSIFAAPGAKLNSEFIAGYLQEVSNLTDVEKLIKDLEKKKIIRFRSFKNQFILFDGTDYDIELELQNASQKVELVNDVVPYIKQHFSFPYVPAKEAFYKTGTPRFFEYVISEEPFEEIIEQPIDGVINLVFGTDVKATKKASKKNNAAIFYGVFEKVEKLRLQIFEIHKVDLLLENIESDKVAENELIALRNSHIEELDQLILHSIYSSDDEIKWIYNGKLIEINGQRAFNSQLSTIIKDVYHKTPVYKNELINKHKVSPAVYRPRKELLRMLMENRYQKDLGFEEDLFPAEKTIYLSLLNHTGLHREENGIWDFYAPTKESELYELWEICEEFFDSTKSGKKPLTRLIASLQKPPVGLKNGFLEIWIPIYVIMKRGDCALYHEEAYVPELTYDVVNLVFRNPKIFEIKAFNIDEKKRELFNKYRTFQNLPSEAEFSNKLFVETIRPFLLTYNELNQYGRNTSKISPEARSLREAIKTATDPEKAFFDSFPQALGYTNLEQLKSKKAINDFVELLSSKISEIEGSFDDLLNRIEEHLLNVLEIDSEKPFQAYTKLIRNKFSSIKSYRLADYQKKLLNRLVSKLDNREKWLSAVGLAVIDKPISKLKDDEEETLFYNLETRLQELESLVELSEQEVDESKDEAFQLELVPFGRNPIKENIKVSKKTLVDHEENLKHIRQQLTGNKKKDLAILFKLIEDIASK
jgi:DNA polymerase III delta prime subunit